MRKDGGHRLPFNVRLTCWIRDHPRKFPIQDGCYLRISLSRHNLGSLQQQESPKQHAHFEAKLTTLIIVKREALPSMIEEALLDPIPDLRRREQQDGGNRDQRE